MGRYNKSCSWDSGWNSTSDRGELIIVCTTYQCLISTDRKALISWPTEISLHAKQTLVPSQHPRSRHRLSAVGDCVLHVDSDHPVRHLCVDPKNRLGSSVVSGESQVLQGRLISGSFWNNSAHALNKLTRQFCGCETNLSLMQSEANHLCLQGSGFYCKCRRGSLPSRLHYWLNNTLSHWF